MPLIKLFVLTNMIRKTWLQLIDSGYFCLRLLFVVDLPQNKIIDSSGDLY